MFLYLSENFRQIHRLQSSYFEVIRIKKGLRIIRIHRERELKKMWMTDQKCTSVQGGGGGGGGVGVGLILFYFVVLLQTLACNVGGHTPTPTPPLQNHLPR